MSTFYVEPSRFLPIRMTDWISASTSCRLVRWLNKAALIATTPEIVVRDGATLPSRCKSMTICRLTLKNQKSASKDNQRKFHLSSPRYRKQTMLRFTGINNSRSGSLKTSVSSSFANSQLRVMISPIVPNPYA